MAGELLLTDMQATEGGTLVSTNSVFGTPTWHHQLTEVSARL